MDSSWNLYKAKITAAITGKHYLILIILIIFVRLPSVYATPKRLCPANPEHLLLIKVKFSQALLLIFLQIFHKSPDNGDN